MKKIIYFGILLFLSIHTGLLSQHLGTNTGDAIKQGTPSLPPNISPACIDETAVPVAPCCDVKIPSNYVRGAGDRVIISEGMTFVYNQLLGIWEWAPAQPVYIFTGYWNYYSKIISTNPDAPYNLERTWTNKFDWRKPTIRGWFPNYLNVFDI